MMSKRLHVVSFNCYILHVLKKPNLIKKLFMANKKIPVLPVLIISGIIAMFVIGICVFLNSTDCYSTPGGKPYCLTGWEALALQWPSFWTWIIICSIIGIACLIFAYYNESGAGKLGKMLMGKTGLTWALVIIGVMLLCGPWAKGCTDKTNGGITAPGHKVEQPAP